MTTSEMSDSRQDNATMAAEVATAYAGKIKVVKLNVDENNNAASPTGAMRARPARRRALIRLCRSQFCMMSSEECGNEFKKF